MCRSFAATDYSVYPGHGSSSYSVFAIGKIDVTDFIDVYGLINLLMHFINLGFSTNPTIAVPNQGLGVAAGAMLTDHLYMQGGFSDANRQPTLAGFDTFFEDNEYFSYIELSLTSSRDRIYLDNVHATPWHTDARQEAQTPEGWGVAVTTEKFYGDKWLPFLRFGYSDEEWGTVIDGVSAKTGDRSPGQSDPCDFLETWCGDRTSGPRAVWRTVTDSAFDLAGQ